MEIVREYVSGLDVHKKSVVAAVITPQGRRVKTFPTTSRALLELVDWLEAEGVRHVAMESTGIYWRPVFNLLEQTEMEVPPLLTWPGVA